MNLDAIALDIAKKIENLFAQHHDTANQRLAKIQIEVRTAMQAALNQTRTVFMHDIARCSCEEPVVKYGQTVVCTTCGLPPRD